MNKEHLYQPFEIVYKSLDECPKGEHKHMFFELVYIISGTGRQCINKNKFDYRAGHMFLITPEDCHSFEIDTTTEFFFLKFNDIYIKSKAFHSEDIERLEYILNNANHQPGCILKNISDKTLVKPIAEAIIREYVNRDIYNKELIQQLVNTLIVVVARNIAKYLPAAVDEKTEEKALDIINYIQKNIYSPAQLRTDIMSSYFGISETYLGKYFKKNTGETIQKYIINHRMKLIEARLKFSDKRINEISGEFGFTDESHFNKFFRKNNGVSPSVYRKEAAQLLTA
ncbi:AraC family transcriptional regulator [Flavobacterium cerinum]|uniref:AraC family transcriptional regulator n=1 Tax=Flavobacterium cerinum TaxID=2502784 RepID=A0A3S3QAV1_9FLAO|nr:AraC family transcriptional regulator [Flavobacterium cerinum]RWX03580.1 AraC family transcriptional regulator [Flavobacterium cerinum]